jgi:hypothetical protein
MLWLSRFGQHSIAIVLLKLLQFRSKLRWALSNLVALLPWNLFTYRDLCKWIDDSYAHAPPQDDPQQLHFFLDSSNAALAPNRISKTPNANRQAAPNQHIPRAGDCFAQQ